MTEKPKHFKDFERDGDDNGITSSELAYILDVNKKAIEIQLEVERQNEAILGALETVSNKLTTHSDNDQKKQFTIDSIYTLLKDQDGRIEEIEKGLFRLTIILSSAGIGAILTIIQALLRH